MNSTSALVLFAHGARDPAWADPFHRIVARVRRLHPQTRVELAFLESMQPDLASVIARLVPDFQRVSVVPLFLAQGGHLREDLPRLIDVIRDNHPGLRIDVAPAIGDSEELTDAIADWAFARYLDAGR
ncbi:MAG: CbiX/SirB N-terminal domain-containing protein [Betaproteobacteria bacterium]